MEGVRMLTSDEDYEVIATVIALILQAFPHLMLAIELADIRPSGNA
ncbi:MAG TPA: hypothetical protein PK765_05520 [bacterium]|nr:hypothetical protein [bacterium]